MSAILCRNLPRLTAVGRRCLSATGVRCADEMMADPVEHATGLEKRELLAKLAGNDNPFDMRVYARGKASKAEPTLIPAALDKRMIGCICEEDATTVNWMWLHKGEPKRCECGYYFKLVDGKFV